MANMFTKLKAVLLRMVSPAAVNTWWPVWSNLRWSKERASGTTYVAPADKVRTLADCQALVRKLYANFEWVADGPDQLWDSICPPPYNYTRYRNGKLRDDCDGFHSLVYHCFKNSGIECYLLAVIATGSSHCVLLFKHGGKWYVNDYDDIHSGFTTAKAAVQDYNTYFKRVYKPTSNVVYNSTLSYDYKGKKFVGAKNIIK